ncbi:unnamed protein product, partial [Symbiodinium microadriaticum]
MALRHGRVGVLLPALVFAVAGSAFCAISSRSRSTASSIARRAAPNFGDLLGNIGKMQEAAKKLPELQKRLRETPSTGTALG